MGSAAGVRWESGDTLAHLGAGEGRHVLRSGFRSCATADFGGADNAYASVPRAVGSIRTRGKKRVASAGRERRSDSAAAAGPSTGRGARAASGGVSLFAGGDGVGGECADRERDRRT